MRPRTPGTRRGVRSRLRRRPCLLVALDRLHQDPLRLGLVAPAGDLGPLALLERLVVLEEVPDALAVAHRQVLQVLDLGLERVDLLDRHGDQLVVHAAVVLHVQDADQPAADHRAGDQRDLGADHDVDRVAVLVQGVRHEAVVVGVEHRHVDDAVDEERARVLVDLVLHRRAAAGAAGDLDDDVDVVGRVLARRDLVELHGRLAPRSVRCGVA